MSDYLRRFKEYSADKYGWADYQRLYQPLLINKVYTLTDLEAPSFQKAVAEAEELWRKRCVATYRKYGDCGSCVLGEGMTVAVKPPKKRTIYKFNFLSAPSRWQGCGTWEPSAPGIVEFLKEQGIDCWFDYGRMD